jgi:hypothetical protein
VKGERKKEKGERKKGKDKTFAFYLSAFTSRKNLSALTSTKSIFAKNGTVRPNPSSHKKGNTTGMALQVCLQRGFALCGIDSVCVLYLI